MNKATALQVGIIGAGLSGLACALELEKHGVEVTIFDKSNQAGGRVKTDFVDGFLLDHGFQVFLTSYDAGKYYFNYQDLQLGTFAPGACLINQETQSIMSDPIRSPSKFIETLLNSNASLKDKLLILKLKYKASKHKKINYKLNEQTTFNFLIQFGFSKKIIQNFFKPFFAGVFLETELNTPAGYFLFLFNKFASGSASLPKAGMQDLALQMQRKLKRKIIFGHEAVSVTKNEIVFNEDNKYTFDQVVLASDVSTVSELGFADQAEWNSVTTLYFKTKSKAFASRYLFLNINYQKYVNHIACLSAAQPSYAPEGWQLFSVNCIGQDLSSNSDSNSNLNLVLKDLKSIFGEHEISKWDFIRSYYIKKALPTNTKYGVSETNKSGVYLCGDIFESPSIEGALMSGYKIAKEITS